MALVLLGKSLCALCNQVMHDGQSIIAIPAVPIASSFLAPFVDAGVHGDCFRAWPLRSQLAAEINAHFNAHYRGMRFMNEDGSIEDREPRSGRPA